MPDENSVAYYLGRERRERHLASAAVNPAIAAIHHELADRYARLATQNDQRGARLMIHC